MTTKHREESRRRAFESCVPPASVANENDIINEDLIQPRRISKTRPLSSFNHHHPALAPPPPTSLHLRPSSVSGQKSRSWRIGPKKAKKQTRNYETSCGGSLSLLTSSPPLPTSVAPSPVPAPSSPAPAVSGVKATAPDFRPTSFALRLLLHASTRQH